MIDATIENLCDQIRETWGCTRIPVDLEHIAREEDVELIPCDFGPPFHGRIEYVTVDNVFMVYHPAESAGHSRQRVRFTIAHELGHFYLPTHRAVLTGGSSHDCEIGFVSDRKMEREADSFAASLLIPHRLLEAEIDKKGMMTLQQVVQMATTAAVSIPCAVIRYVHYATEPCGVVLSEKGKVKYYIASDDMDAKGFRIMPKNSEIPRDSKAWQLLASGKHREAEGRKADSRSWYSRRPQYMTLWEDSLSLGYADQVITLLSASD